jgi:Domain of unknown function (DUF4189)
MFEKKHFTGDGSKWTWTLDPKPWTYTALAVSDSTNDFGVSTGRTSREEAKSEASERCNRSVSDCTVRQLVRDDACLAVAIGRYEGGGTHLQSSAGENAYEAQRNAQDGCRDTGARLCRVRWESCSP